MERQGRLRRRWIFKPTGSGNQGVMLFWDDTLQAYVPTEATELVWDDTNKWLQPAALQVQDTSGNIIFHVDDDELYFTTPTVIPIEAGMPMGLLLSLTYAAP
jgi:hypothetical protein